jgi:hypothetical protein
MFDTQQLTACATILTFLMQPNLEVIPTQVVDFKYY